MTPPPGIHQFTAGFTRHDAISNEVIHLQSIFRRWGCASEVVSESTRIMTALRKQVRDVHTVAADAFPREHAAILHLSAGSVVNDVFARLRCRKIILYHNVTPPGYFALLNPQVATCLDAGLRQVRTLAGCADINLAVSRFNADELQALGYRDVDVLPLLLDFSQLEIPPDRAILQRFGDGRTNLLFVGRCVPNKRLEDLLTFTHYYQRHVNPDVRLIHAGSFAGTEQYHHLLKTRARELGLENVEFLGAIPQASLNACYRVAHGFVCMSEHEGFCIPVLEAMTLGVPVFAFDAGALRETMDGAGVLFARKDLPLMAETVGRVLGDPPLREAVVAAQHKRVARYRAVDLEGRLRHILERLPA